MITKEQVQHIAGLAHIRLQEQEVEKFRKDFASILEYFEILNEVDTAKVEPMTHPGSKEKKGRQDKPRQETEERRSKLLSSFPFAQEKFLQVPQIPWQSGKSTNNS
ncbi:MAG: Asp-tRNA(Asn)/Glu-tRNA(Gln) amidotransferase subunit GatC [Parcubacteria group bacterium]|nr:Asp-tRNA(Asn)/Glu-tRNA(Gln) amidotransferase subunit GatC [Parcubacteria group bacterium]